MRFAEKKIGTKHFDDLLVKLLCDSLNNQLMIVML